MGPPVPPVLPPPRPPSWRSPPPWSPWCRPTKLAIRCAVTLPRLSFSLFFSIPPVLILDFRRGVVGGRSTPCPIGASLLLPVIGGCLVFIAYFERVNSQRGARFESWDGGN